MWRTMAAERERDAQLEEAFRREHELLERIFETVPIMMTIYEPNTNVLRVNRAFERLIGWSSDELAAVPLMEKCYPDPQYREQAREFMQACLPEWRNFRVTTRAGGEVESSWTNVRLSDDRQLGLGIDVTERERADRLKDEFLATLAHELRNPLSPMRNAVEILRSDRGPRALASEALSILDRQLSFMVRLVDDLLDVSRIRTGKIDLRRSRVDLGPIVQNAIESSRPHFQSKGHKLVLEQTPGLPLFVDGDSTRLEQVVANLLHNAAKFTPTAGVVSLSVGSQGAEAVVRVRDSGVGIPSDILPRVFDMFVQADRSVDRAHAGLGIGLSLVKRLVEMHGGSVQAFSAGVGQGSELVVRLPLLTRQPDEPAISPEHSAVQQGLAQATAPRPRTVLVVDDNVDAATTLAQLLSSWGHDVLVAYDGQSAIEIGRTQRLDAIVMDLGMPGISGYSAARQIRADPRLGGVVLVALSGWSQQEARQQSAEAGFDHHLVKPADLTILRNILAGG
jgi:PAS domain S-box-containing protein